MTVRLGAAAAGQAPAITDPSTTTETASTRTTRMAIPPQHPEMQPAWIMIRIAVLHKTPRDAAVVSSLVTTTLRARPSRSRVTFSSYGAEYRGIVQYYLLAGNVHRLSRLHWVMETSLLKTLANKHRSSVSKMARKYKATIDTPHGPRKCLQASVERGGRKPLVARFGGIPLRRQKDAAVTDRAPAPGIIRRKELVTRLLADRCEIYANTDGIQVHHVRRLADLDLPGP